MQSWNSIWFQQFHGSSTSWKKISPKKTMHMKRCQSQTLKILSQGSKFKAVYRKIKIKSDYLDRPFTFLQFLKWHFISKFLLWITGNRHWVTFLIKKILSCIFPMTWTCNPKELALIFPYRNLEIMCAGQFYQTKDFLK